MAPGALALITYRLLSGASRVVESEIITYSRCWKATVMSSIVYPLVHLVGIGLGIGSLLASGHIGWIESNYVDYLATGLLIAACVQTAAHEGSFRVLEGFRWKRTYWAVSATPITYGQLVAGTLVWVCLRLIFVMLAFTSVAAMVGVSSTASLKVFANGLLVGITYFACVYAYSAGVNDEGQKFNIVFRFFVTPSILFGGTYFPIDLLPSGIGEALQFLPTSIANSVARGDFAAGSNAPMYGALYLGALCCAALWLAKVRISERFTSS